MYQFRDTTSLGGKMDLPSEALKINGEYIEDRIAGYRTLYVKGRERLSPELTTSETGVRDGSYLTSKRYPARTITVGYQLLAPSNEAFRSAYNALNAILDVEEAELIFADEPDKFFIGTPSEASDVSPGRNAVTGEFEILCADPFKYSVTEYEAAPTLDDGTTFAISYNGTYRAYPTLEAAFYTENEAGETGTADTALTGNGDCGYVAFFNEQGNILQFGDPEEEDLANYPKSQTLVSQSFTNVTKWTEALNTKWLKNQGVVSPGIEAQTGTTSFVYSSNNPEDGRFLHAETYGTGTTYHGPTITRVLPADASGHTGAADWTLKWKQKLSIGNGKSDNTQCGCFQLSLTDADDRFVAGLYIFKSGSGNKATLRLYVNHKAVKDISIDISYHNLMFGNNSTPKGIKTVKSSSIIKSGNQVKFNVGGRVESFVDDGITDKEVEKITFVFGQYGSKPTFSYNGLYSTSFVKNNCDTWQNVPNKFGSGDVLAADCKTGVVTLNDMPAPELGALGNDWEAFCLHPGQNQIGVSYSDWVPKANAPTFRLRYREVFL